MNITILWSSLAGYSVAFFRELKRHCNCEIQLIYQPISKEAPYDQFDLSFCSEIFEDSSVIAISLEDICISFKPDCVLMNSWSFPHYMHTSKKLRHYGSYVVSVMDNQWRGSIKQWIGILSSRWFLKKAIDTFIVAGDRQAYFARKLGYDQVMYGCYAAETSIFRCRKPLNERSQNFLFFGRIIKSKGIDLLISAYKCYRKTVKKPWGLVVVGIGDMENILEDIPGLKHLGFIPPNKLPLKMELARCLVLPSRFEPWGVVIQEAAAASLPIIATHSCGATTNYVRDGVNGFIIPPTVEKLIEAMCQISELSTRIGRNGRC